jgi:hypothetical protein
MYSTGTVLHSLCLLSVGRVDRPMHSTEETRVSDPDLDPDPYWISIQSGQWIRIRIRNPDPDPDPGGQK